MRVRGSKLASTPDDRCSHFILECPNYCKKTEKGCDVTY